MDKESWGEGEWQHEPDLATWNATPSNYPCVTARHPALGYWLGYVGIPPGHPLHGAGLDHPHVQHALWAHHEPLDFADLSHDQFASLDDPPGYWWFGFNCGHLEENDLIPAFVSALHATQPPPHLHAAHQRLLSKVYRTLPYVREQCEDLAQQLARQAAL